MSAERLFRDSENAQNPSRPAKQRPNLFLIQFCNGRFRDTQIDETLLLDFGALTPWTRFLTGPDSIFVAVKTRCHRYILRKISVKLTNVPSRVRLSRQKLELSGACLQAEDVAATNAMLVAVVQHRHKPMM